MLSQLNLKETQKTIDEQLVPVRTMLADAQTRTYCDNFLYVIGGMLLLSSSHNSLCFWKICFFMDAELLKANEFRRTHPEAAVAGLVAVVGLPSLLLRALLFACSSCIAGCAVASLTLFSTRCWN